MEPLENRALLTVDAFGTTALADVGETWGPDPAPVFSASELSTDAAETTISPVAALVFSHSADSSKLVINDCTIFLSAKSFLTTTTACGNPEKPSSFSSAHATSYNF
jgi:hypothetical protein